MSVTMEDVFRQVAGGSGGPLYLRLQKSIEDAVRSGLVKAGDALPSERDIAAIADVSRVTVRKAVQHLVRDGILIQRHGSGTFVAPEVQKVEQSLSSLTSFTEDMARRGMTLRSEWLERGLYVPSPEESVILGLSSHEKVARIARLRIANEIPMAIERATLAASILPDPGAITDSLYAKLDETGNRPVRALQRIAAINLGDTDAALLGVAPGSAALRIERTSYLASGRIVESTRSVYRGDAYDFVAELRLGAPE
ncbi:GntR family transcriptional regulator [Pelagibacterium limicola]|uniref:GntR family transcriptional regulator n=1 Tax=Pelagibacterium limicola TaxID=2791022 RepID=UPI0018AFD19B|nr:GntR family transcriptional regulator [Pelagibacterium limicola]